MRGESNADARRRIGSAAAFSVASRNEAKPSGVGKTRLSSLVVVPALRTALASSEVARTAASKILDEAEASLVHGGAPSSSTNPSAFSLAPNGSPGTRSLDVGRRTHPTASAEQLAGSVGSTGCGGGWSTAGVGRKMQPACPCFTHEVGPAPVGAPPGTHCCSDGYRYRPCVVADHPGLAGGRSGGGGGRSAPCACWARSKSAMRSV